MDQQIYLDYAASTSIDPVVIDVMFTAMEMTGNPHAKTHLSGLNAEKTINHACQEIADHIIFSKIEHKSVLNVLKNLEEGHGFTVTYLAPKSCGMIEAEFIQLALTEENGLVSIQAINNEVGVINPLTEIGDLLKNTDILFHIGGAQALSKMT